MDVTEQQFENTYEAYSDAIFRHLYYRLGSRDRALELTQEVFTRYWQYTKQGGAVEHPKAFLYRSAHNAFVNEIRKAPAPISLDALMENGFELHYEEADTADLERQEELIAKVRSLEGKSRDALVLRYIDGFSVKEIASLLGERENTISVRIRRGLQKLKDTYGPDA
jgi:RNA polymerase sigma-70 factor, ECF subfamily